MKGDLLWLGRLKKFINSVQRMLSRTSLSFTFFMFVIQIVLRVYSWVYVCVCVFLYLIINLIRLSRLTPSSLLSARLAAKGHPFGHSVPFRFLGTLLVSSHPEAGLKTRRLLEVRYLTGHPANSWLFAALLAARCRYQCSMPSWSREHQCAASTSSQ